MNREWPMFIRNVFERLDMGRLTYGDDSFDKTPQRLIFEIEQELLDQAGWAFIAWVQLQRTKEKLRRLP